MGVPDGDAQPLLRQLEVGDQAGQTAHRIEPLQALANHEILHPDREPDGGAVGDGSGGLAGSVFIAYAVVRAFDPSGVQLPDQCQPECGGDEEFRGSGPGRRRAALDTGRAGAQLPAASFPAGAVHRFAFHFHTGAEFSRDAIFLPRALSAGSAAGRAVAVVDPGAAKARGGLRQLQPVFVDLPGRGRSDRGRAVAQGGMPCLFELHRGVPA